MLPHLPIDDVLGDLLAALESHNSAVLKAPTGAGKTTRVPPALLGASWLAPTDTILLLEPRRIAARAAARRMAFELGTRVGDTIGYQIRFDRRASKATRVLVVTEGILVRMLQHDPFLEGVGAVVLDEFHERSLNTDLSLAMTRRVQNDVRPDLRILVMSATLDPTPIAHYLGDCPSVVSEGRSWPVDIQYIERTPRTNRPSELATLGVRRAAEHDGDLLVFLPGVGEIRRTQTALSSWAEEQNIALLPLYGDLPPEKQDAVLQPGPRRRVVLATNVAETSITLNGIRGVVDTGYAKVMRFNPDTGLNRLELTRISHASADQRAGRAGRTEPGFCLRMWTSRENAHMQDHELPEIQRVDLTGTVLELTAWGESDLHDFCWFQPPAPEAISKARELLTLLGALDARGITSLGNKMAALPLHPRLARLVLEGVQLGHTRDAALCAALLSERDPFSNSDQPLQSGRSDLVDRLDALLAFAARRPTRARLNAGTAHFILKAHKQLVAQLKNAAPATSIDRDTAIERALLAAYPDRVARRRRPNEPRALMVGGMGVKVVDSTVLEPEFFVCVNLHNPPHHGRHGESWVRLASAIEPEWLEQQTTTEVEFDQARERVMVMRRTRYHDLLLREQNAQPRPSDAYAIAEALADAARLDLKKALDLTHRKTANLLLRLRTLARWMPDLDLPDFEHDALAALLPSLCEGRRSFEELRKAPLVPLILGSMTYAQRKSLDQLAPEQYQVPSGSRIWLKYQPEGPPVLAVRIQEMFGLAETPTIANGRVSLLLHLLAPNQRPQQITNDLSSFWTNTYPEVRKELRQRYPKHAWPEDPITASPQRRPSRRKR